jgi:hypothetical protein
MFVQWQRRTNDNSGSRGDNALREWTAIKHVLWSAESGNLPYKIEANWYNMSSVAISSKGDNYLENNKSKTKTNESIHCTNQGPDDRILRNDKMKYNTDGSLHCTNLGLEDRIPKGSLHCTNQGPEDRIPRNDKMTYDTNGSLHCTIYGPRDHIPRNNKTE